MLTSGGGGGGGGEDVGGVPRGPVDTAPAQAPEALGTSRAKSLVRARTIC
jgi:hypothetical protein